MKHFPQDVLNRPHMQRECKIISRIISAALKGGYSISVNDGEDTTLLRSTSRKEIEAECFATDETILYFVRDFDPKGCVWLVHGNDLDVITDHTDAVELDAILKPAQDWINKQF